MAFFCGSASLLSVDGTWIIWKLWNGPLEDGQWLRASFLWCRGATWPKKNVWHFETLSWLKIETRTSYCRGRSSDFLNASSLNDFVQKNPAWQKNKQKTQASMSQRKLLLLLLPLLLLLLLLLPLEMIRHNFSVHPGSPATFQHPEISPTAMT